MSEPIQHRIVLTTAGTATQARQIARGLVEERLAACVNVLGGGCSIYRWQGSVEEEEEVLLVIKTSAELFPRVRDEIKRRHSYDVPEVVLLPVLDGAPDYLAWWADCLGGEPAD